MRPGNIFYGWWIVTISMAIDALKHGTFNRGISFYVLPVSKELGVGVAAISLADMLGRLAGGLLGPLAGYCTDRFGPRAMLIFGGVTSGLGFVLLAFSQNYIYFLLVFVGLLSLGFRSGYNNALVPALNQWFRRRRALAMSVASTGHGLGGLALAPIVGVMVLAIGWQNAAIVSGIAIIVVVVPSRYWCGGPRRAWASFPTGHRPNPSRPKLRLLVARPEVLTPAALRPLRQFSRFAVPGAKPTSQSERPCGPLLIGSWCWLSGCATPSIQGCPSCWCR